MFCAFIWLAMSPVTAERAMANSNDSKHEHPPTLRTVKTFSERYPEFPQGGLRHLIFESEPRESSKGRIEGNGFAPAFLRLGRKVLIHERRFFEILEKRQRSA